MRVRREDLAVLRALRSHLSLQRELEKLLAKHAGADCLRWPFAKPYRPWLGRQPDAAQAAAIAWRSGLSEAMEAIESLYEGYGSDREAELFPLVDYESPEVESRDYRWVLATLAQQADVLRARLRRGRTSTTLPAPSRSKPAPRTGRTGAAVELVTVAEAAAILNVKRWRVYELCRRDAIPGIVRIGRQVRIAREGLLQLIEEGGFRLAGGWKYDPD